MLGAQPHDLQIFQVLLIGDRRLDDLHPHQDRGEHVVEVVGDAAGERANAFHALRSQELLLKLLALGEIERETDAFVWRIFEGRRPDQCVDT